MPRLETLLDKKGKIERPLTEKELKRRIDEVKKVRAYGESLGMEFGSAFSEAHITDNAKMYFVYGAERNSLQPIKSWNGRLCSLFYDKDGAKDFAKSIEECGYDALIFDGLSPSKYLPIYKSFLERPLEQRIWTVLHEGLHIHHHSNSVDLPLSMEEAIADYVGFAGAKEYAKKHNKKALGSVEGEEREFGKFLSLVEKYYGKLDECYEKNGKRSPILAEAKEAFDEMGKTTTSPAVRERCALPINNAFFVRYRNYSKNDLLVKEVLGRQTLKEYFKDPHSVHKELLDRVSREDRK